MKPERVLSTLDYLVQEEHALNDMTENRSALKNRTKKYFEMLGKIGLAGGGRYWRSRFHALRKGIANFRSEDFASKYPAALSYYNQRLPFYRGAIARVQTDNIAPKSFNQIPTIDSDTGKVDKQGVSAPGILQAILDGQEDPTAPYYAKQKGKGRKSKGRGRTKRATYVNKLSQKYCPHMRRLNGKYSRTSRSHRLRYRGRTYTFKTCCS